ncbi:MAG: class I SAM-dependent methyltransferase [Phycisphaerae bacterium]|nr:class I SAM-dependent methyltransferase [Phycisphaerae bacterium]
MRKGEKNEEIYKCGYSVGANLAVNGGFESLKERTMAKRVDYNNIYSNSSTEHFVWVKKACLWKAGIIHDLTKNKSFNSILEIGTGRGDVLDALNGFERKIGADISEEALKQHKLIYPEHELVKIDADERLPFADDQFDCVLLCDILEHVDKPVDLLKEASRVGKYLILKIPVEKAIFVKIMQKIRGLDYGINHPAGHLHCWNLRDIYSLLAKAKINIIDEKFWPTPTMLLEKKFAVKIITFRICALLDKVFSTSFFNRTLLGGSYFAVGQKC